MEREIARLLPYILGGMFIAGLLLFLLALHQLRLRRTGAYWRLRRKAGERGGRLFLISAGLITSSLVLTVIIGLASLAFKNVSEFLNRGSDNLYGIVLPPDSALTATHDAVAQAFTATRMYVETLTTSTPAPTPTATPVPPTRTPRPSATATTTYTPTPTPSPLLNLTPLFNVTPRTPSTDYHLTLAAAADAMDANGTIPPSSQTFSAGIKRIYLFISFENMENGVAWSRVLYRDDVPIQGNTLLWSLGATGSSYFFFGDESGYPPGAYEVRLFVGDHEASRYTFSVRSR